MATATYRMYELWRFQTLAMFGVFAILGVVALIATLSENSGPPLLFVALWLLVVVWNAYWFLLRIAYRLDLAGAELRWRAPLRSGVIDLAQLVEMRPHRFGSSVEVLQLQDGSKVLVMVRKGFVDFAA